MKRLILIRHAKSSWKYPELDDHDRPLNKRGKRDAPAMANLLAQQRLSVDLLYASTAVRAVTLAQAICTKMGCELVLDRTLYTFSANQLFRFIRSLDNSLENVAVVGHNPAMTMFCNRLSDTYIENMPTSGVAILSVESNKWAEIDNVPVRMERLLTPKKDLV